MKDALQQVQVRDASAPLVFVDAEAVQASDVLVGRCRRDGKVVSVTARIFLRGDTVGEARVEGTSSGLGALV